MLTMDLPGKECEENSRVEHTTPAEHYEGLNENLSLYNWHDITKKLTNTSTCMYFYE